MPIFHTLYATVLNNVVLTNIEMAEIFEGRVCYSVERERM